MPHTTDLEQFILDDFEDALEKQRILPYYQPVVRTISRRLCSFEALARWEDPVRGVIPPDQFIGVLEDHRLIHRLDAAIVRQVCARIRLTIDLGFTPIPVSVNLSRLDFELCDIFEAVEESVAFYRIPRDFLYIEITESQIAEHEEAMHRMIDRFRSAGHQVWMDDFGSRYSSLNLLKDYEFDELKIDMRFLSSFSLRSRKIITSIIQMAKDIDIHTLAEGVENEDQFRFLRDIGCEKVQGFLFGRPLPYAQALEHLRKTGIRVELPKERSYYDALGLINVLSAVPFMSMQERDRLDNALQLNSIPLALIELRGESFRFLFYNTGFETVASSTHWGAHLFSQDMLGISVPVSNIPARGITMLEEARDSGAAKLYFISGGEYYEFQAKCASKTDEAYSVLLRLDNLSRNAELARTSTLDTGLRHIYAMFERVTLMDLEADTILPLYVGTHDEKVSPGGTVRERTAAYAEQWIFPGDRGDFLAFMDSSTLEKRLQEAGRTHITGCFRTYNRHGRYSWKQHFLVRLRSGAFLLLMRDSEAEVRHLLDLFGRDGAPPSDPDALSGEMLWENLVRSGVARLFWKDEQRRFLGASKGFLDFFGFGSTDCIIGRTDEELGWHIDPDPYRSDEWRVLREGIPTWNVPGKCLARGDNRSILASKAPVYNEFGRIVGLVGCFTDGSDAIDPRDPGSDLSRRDPLTSLLNSRGIAEECHAYQDEYFRRNVDFARIHVAIEDFATINQEYGYDHGDRILKEVGRALVELLGTRAVIGRLSGFHFVILYQFDREEDAYALTGEIKAIASQIREVNGVPLTLYLALGLCLFSEFEDITEQAQQADIRVLADHNESAPAVYKITRAAEIFRMYDHLPVDFAAYKVHLRDNRVYDAELIYVNRSYARAQNKTPEQVLGRTVRELFPQLEPQWYDMAYQAAVNGKESIVENMRIEEMRRNYYVTVSQVIRPGYCAFTYQELDLSGGTVPSAPSGK